MSSLSVNTLRESDSAQYFFTETRLWSLERPLFTDVPCPSSLAL